MESVPCVPQCQPVDCGDSHQYRVAARLSLITMCVYMRNAVLHVAVGPRPVAAQSTFLKKWTWSVCGRFLVQSWVTVDASAVWPWGLEEDMSFTCQD